MADPNKYKSVSVPLETYKILLFLSDGKLTDATLTISKTIEDLAKKAAKTRGYKKNGHSK
jgi:DNA/RNA endonuclease G (NUC1)